VAYFAANRLGNPKNLQGKAFQQISLTNSFYYKGDLGTSFGENLGSELGSKGTLSQSECSELLGPLRASGMKPLFGHG